MKKLLASIHKETLLLKRDIEGVILLFIMPLSLVIVMALLQHRTFQILNESKIPVVIVDHDNDSLGISFCEGIKQSKVFDVTVITSHDSMLFEKAKQDVALGKYQIGILIPEKSTVIIKKRAIAMVQQQLPNNFTSNLQSNINQQITIKLFFDPITKESFRGLAQSTFNEFASKTEARIIFQTYSKVIDALTNQVSHIDFPSQPALKFEEAFVSEYTAGIIPNAVQHNVPAWTLFGMFLICIPIAGNIIKERNEGCMARLKTIPVSYLGIMSGKSFVFIVICLLQASLIVLTGIFIMPLIGLPALQIGNNWLALFVITIASAFAASGFGVAIGTIATSQIQASTFGSVATVILAAIGGVWIPIIAMPEVMRTISSFSPMNWGIQGYYDVFLRNAGTLIILPNALKLFAFYAFCTAISLYFRKYRANR
jgi:ABC-2 type transport system permease protein